jgi:hypothetical protein
MSKYSDLPILVKENNGLQEVELTEGEFSGIIYTYGKVEFVEDNSNEHVKLSFEYDIVNLNNKVIKDTKQFETYIGKILENLIQIGIENNSITYTGGVDENRAKDSGKSDL